MRYERHAIETKSRKGISRSENTARLPSQSGRSRGARRGQINGGIPCPINGLIEPERGQVEGRSFRRSPAGAVEKKAANLSNEVHELRLRREKSSRWLCNPPS